jgi:hypothetical protein
MREEPAFSSLPFFIRTESRAFRLSLDVEPGLAHPGPRPDFHRKDGFLLTIPAE